MLLSSLTLKFKYYRHNPAQDHKLFSLVSRSIFEKIISNNEIYILCHVPVFFDDEEFFEKVDKIQF